MPHESRGRSRAHTTQFAVPHCVWCLVTKERATFQPLYGQYYPASPNLHLIPRRTDKHYFLEARSGPKLWARPLVGRSSSETWSEYWNGFLLAPVLGSGRKLHTYIQWSSGSHFCTRRAQKQKHEKCIQILPLRDQVQLKYSWICGYCKYWLTFSCTATPAVAYKMFSVSSDFSEIVNCIKST